MGVNWRVSGAHYHKVIVPVEVNKTDAPTLVSFDIYILLHFEGDVSLVFTNFGFVITTAVCRDISCYNLISISCQYFCHGECELGTPYGQGTDHD